MSITFSRDRTFPSDMRGYGLPKPSADDLFAPPEPAPYQEEAFPIPEAADQGPLPQVTPAIPPPSPVPEVKSMLSMLPVPFCAYLAFNDKLPGWARLLAAAGGAALLFRGVKESE